MQDCLRCFPRLAAAAVVLTLSAVAAEGQTASEADIAFDMAQLAYERSHWPEAYAGFLLLADSGHAEAARIALLMHRYGPRLYGLHFEAGDAQVDRWSRLWALNIPSVPARSTNLVTTR